MSSLEAAQVATLVIFAVNAALVASLIVLKTVNRSRRSRAERRKSAYMRLVSRHVTYPNCTDPIPDNAASDPAFIDALIDVRNALVGADLDTLQEIATRHGVISHQVDRLRSAVNRARRLQAAVALAELGDESTANVLVDHLADRVPEVRIQAARGLGRMRWTPAIDAIVSRFSIETPWVRARFADTLVGFGSTATWPLLAYVRVNHRHETAGPIAAIRAIAAIGDDQAVQPLIELVHDTQDPETRIAIIDTLGTLGNPVAAPMLRNSAHSGDWRIRAKAVTALGLVGDIGSLELLARALTDSNWWVRRNAAESLARLPGGIDHLFEALMGDDRFAADAAAEALTDTGELAASRRRHDEGRAGGRDLVLIGHMAGDA